MEKKTLHIGIKAIIALPPFRGSMTTSTLSRAAWGRGRRNPGHNMSSQLPLQMASSYRARAARQT
eukprot:330300-Amphidinium_carterae.1